MRVLDVCVRVDDCPGGLVASYGAGIATSKYTHCAIGVGRSPHEAGSDAVDQLCDHLPFDLDGESLAKLEEALAELGTDTSACDEMEEMVFGDLCHEMFGKLPKDCTPEEQDEAATALYDGEAIELTAAVFVVMSEAEVEAVR